MDSAEALGAYLLHYWPASFLQVGRALDRSGLPAPRRVLDVGAGPGPAAAACAARGAERIAAVDSSERALAVAGRLLAPSGASFSARPWRAGGIDSAAPFAGEDDWDLIVLSHSLNEFHFAPGLMPASRAAGSRTALVESLVPSLSPEGWILIVEPALLATSRGLIALRDDLLSRGWTVAAPCIFAGPCPALAAGEGQTCHDAFPWEAPYFTDAIAKRAGLDRSELKMAWFALKPPRALSPENADSIPGARADEGGRTAVAAPDAGDCLVVSDPMLNKAGRTRFMLCGAAGRFSLSAKLDALPPGCGAFADLARGMVVRVRGAEERGGSGRGLVPGSTVEIIER